MKAALLKVWSTKWCQAANGLLLVHHEIGSETESKHLETFTGIWQNNFLSDEYFIDIEKYIWDFILYIFHCLFLAIYFYKCIFSQKQNEEHGPSPQFKKNDMIVLVSLYHPQL